MTAIGNSHSVSVQHPKIEDKEGYAQAGAFMANAVPAPAPATPSLFSGSENRVALTDEQRRGSVWS